MEHLDPPAADGQLRRSRAPGVARQWHAARRAVPSAQEGLHRRRGQSTRSQARGRSDTAVC